METTAATLLLVNVDVDGSSAGTTHTHTIHNMAVDVVLSYRCVCAPALLICRKRSPRDPLLEKSYMSCVNQVIAVMRSCCKAVVEHEIQNSNTNSTSLQYDYNSNCVIIHYVLLTEFQDVSRGP